MINILIKEYKKLRKSGKSKVRFDYNIFLLLPVFKLPGLTATTLYNDDRLNATNTAIPNLKYKKTFATHTQTIYLYVTIQFGSRKLKLSKIQVWNKKCLF